MDDEDGDFYPEDSLQAPDSRPFIERAGSFIVANSYVLIIAALVAGLIVFVSLAPSGPELSQANFSIIQQGMNEQAINTLLKCEATGRPRVPPPVIYTENVDGKDVTRPVAWKEWSDGEARIIIGFVDGRVWHKTAEGALKAR